MRADRNARSAGPARSRTTPKGRGKRGADPLIGRVLEGRYEITTQIARGGMASVYEAYDQRLDRTVAIKVMHPGMGDEEAFAARFVREARAAAKLSHPHVVAVYDQGEDDGDVFLAMELVAGHTLRDTLNREAPMRPARALDLIEPVLSALAAAHQAGLVHRDVKPENVLIADPGGEVKVADFGLARAVTAETTHTSSGVLIGTVSYIAPELVIEGKADARADVYSVGVMLYELLTGEKPHAGETPIQVAYKHVHDDVPPPSQRVPGLPPYVDALVARATARDRDLRPSDASVLLRQVRQVASALRDGLADDPDLTADLALPVHPVAEDTIEEPTTGPTGPAAYGDEHTARLERPAGTQTQAVPTAAPRRRRRRPLIGLLVLLLVVAGGAGGWWLFEGRYTHAPALVGLSQKQATARLTSAGLDIDPQKAFSDTVPRGQVISADPGRNGKVLPGGTVEVTISKGVEQYKLPQLAEVPLASAEHRLEDIKMDVLDPVKVWSETIPSGQVVRTDPKAGTVLRPDTEVHVYVSKGRQPIKLTDWEGKAAAAATKWMHHKKLKVDTERQYSDSVPAGKVISQSPDAHTTLHKHDTVTLLVSRGPELITVPDVRGHGVDAATSELEGAGFHVEVTHFTPYFGLGYVMSEESVGQRVPKGSTITLSVS